MEENKEILDDVATTNVVADASSIVAPSQLPQEQYVASMKKKRTMVCEYKKVGRNDKCPCGSGKKYKKCCLEDEKYEGYHELTSREMAMVKDHKVKLSSFTKVA